MLQNYNSYKTTRYNTSSICEGNISFQIEVFNVTAASVMVLCDHFSTQTPAVSRMTIRMLNDLLHIIYYYNCEIIRVVINILKENSCLINT